MSFHLAHPSLTTTGKKKYKRKRQFKNAAEAQRARELKEYMDKHGIESAMATKYKKKFVEYIPNSNYKKQTKNIPSNESPMIPCIKKETIFYTGDRLIGIAVLHKSCLQPVFSKEEAEAAAKMRRG